MGFLKRYCISQPILKLCILCSSAQYTCAQDRIPELIDLESLFGLDTFDFNISNELDRPASVLNYRSSAYSSQSRTGDFFDTTEVIAIPAFGEFGIRGFYFGDSVLEAPILGGSIRTYNGAIKDLTGDVSLAPAEKMSLDLTAAREYLDDTLTPSTLTFSYSSFLLENHNAHNYSFTFYDKDDEVVETFLMQETFNGIETDNTLTITEREGGIVDYVVYNTTSQGSTFRPRVALDDFSLSLSAVPEPSSFFLGMLGLGMLSKRRR